MCIGLAAPTATGATRSVSDLRRLFERQSPTSSVAKTTAKTDTTSALPTTMSATATAAIMTTTDGQQAFEDAAIFVVVAFLHWCVCFGGAFGAVATPIVEWIALRLAMGLCATARGQQQPTAKATTTTTPTTRFVRSVLPAVVPFTEDDQTIAACAKASPAVGTRITRGTKVCTLLWSSLNVSATQRAKTDHARNVLADLLIEFIECDVAHWPADHLAVLSLASGERSGVFPLLFVETSPTAKEDADALANMDDGMDADMDADAPVPGVRYVSYDQLVQAEFYAGVPLAELTRLDAVAASVHVLFKDVATQLLPTHTLAAQARALLALVVTPVALNELHQAWQR